MSRTQCRNPYRVDKYFCKAYLTKEVKEDSETHKDKEILCSKTVKEAYRYNQVKEAYHSKQVKKVDHSKQVKELAIVTYDYI